MAIVQQIHEDIERILYTENDVRQHVADMGRQITRDYAGKPLIVISVLRGAAIFMADLVREIHLPLEMDYMAVSSYGAGVKSTGVVNIQKDLTSSVEGRHILIAEDIIDSGLTLSHLITNLEKRNPASVAVAALLRKKTQNQVPIDCAYLAFECPDEFIVGYGLDFAERYRNLPYIGVLKPEVYAGAPGA